MRKISSLDSRRRSVSTFNLADKMQPLYAKVGNFVDITFEFSEKERD